MPCGIWAFFRAAFQRDAFVGLFRAVFLTDPGRANRKRRFECRRRDQRQGEPYDFRR